ncbi:MAG: hypothetical protein V4502_08165 [Pseudomonadota bacterium]
MTPRPILLTQLGAALGCPASRPDTPATRCSSEPGRGERARAARTAAEPALPEECYYSGPLDALGPAPAPHVHAALSWGYMDREASEMAAQSREDLIRFFQMKARIARRGRKSGRRALACSA